MKEYLIVFLKGLAMGMADIVPGVSGGTIAFISGIYERLLNAIANIPVGFLLLLKGQFKAAWKKADATFLIALLAGMLLSIIIFARLITWLLETHPIIVWAFFFGLVIVSCYLVGREVGKWNLWNIIAFVIGAGFAYWITVAASIQWGHDYLSIFIAGAIAICAMILPGISGSFILLIMGIYGFILTAVKELNMPILLIFAAGCAFGIIAFSHALKALLRHFHDFTLALLLGTLFGSLNKVWPWKHATETYINNQGKITVVHEQNLWPWDYAEKLNLDAQLPLALLLAICGILAVLSLEFLAKQLRTK
ncbi:DUF368 domain-containing protein [Pseudomonas sp. F1_0610]|uniref:DUF368 domain-containing protein n=1 Tax=Pseudomonas sp. F1_0610 TaxID=3114284 RepID=UPI0039C32EC9